MPRIAGPWLPCVAGLIVSLSGCAQQMVPADQLHVSQRHARNLYAQNRTITAQREAATVELNAFAQQVASLQSDLNVATGRLDNLLAERTRVQQRYVSLLQQQGGSPLSADATQRFEELAARYPDLEFDPISGVSKFDADILFDSGSDELKPSAVPLLQEVADILNAGEQRELRLLVVGHTDDRRIVRKATQQRHRTNWHLSTNRSNAVVLALVKNGIRQKRLGAMGYSRFQPATENLDDATRQQNRRVEIYVLAPDTLIAGSTTAIRG